MCIRLSTIHFCLHKLIALENEKVRCHHTLDRISLILLDTISRYRHLHMSLLQLITSNKKDSLLNLTSSSANIKYVLGLFFFEKYTRRRSQGAQTLVHLPQKPPITETWIFWCKMTWGTMFTKVILLSMVESIY